MPEDVQIEPIVDIGPFKGWDTWQSPWYMEQSVLTDVSFMQFDESLGGIVTAKGRENLFTALTDPLGFDVFYRSTGQAYAVVVADGVWKLIDYIGLTAPVNFTLPASGWDAAAQTYFTFIGNSLNQQVLFATNGVSVPLKVLGDFNPAAPVATKAGLTTPTSAPILAAGAAGNPNGTYRYRVTTESSSHESSQGPISLPITVITQRINLTGIYVSPDPTVTRRLIWRIGGSIAEWRLVGTINDNTTTAAEDNVSDLDLGRLMDIDRDPPPSGLTVTVPHKGRVFGFIGKDLQFSNYDEPEGWDAANQLPIGRGDNIVTLGTTGSVLIVFKKNQTWGLFGETIQDFVPLKLFDVGCVGPRAVVSTPGRVYWLAEDGIRSSSGRDEDFAGLPMYIKVRDLPSAAKNTCVMSYGLGKLVVAFPDAVPAFMLVKDLKTQEWESYPFGPRHLLPLFAGSDPGFFAFTEYTAAPTFAIRRWPGAVYGDLGGTSAWLLERKYLDSGAGKAIKVWREFEVDAPKHVAGTTVTLTLTMEDDTVNKQYSTSVPLDSGPIRVGLPAPLRGTYGAIRIEGSHSIKIEIQKIRIWGHIERGYSRDKS